MNEKVDIAIACGASQHVKWWGALVGTLLQEQARGIQIGQIIAVGSALPDFNKNDMIGGLVATEFASPEEKDRNKKTDANRTVAAKRFLAGDENHKDNDGNQWKADWLMWFDDDTVMEPDVITRLLALNKLAVGGLYFNPNPPKNPICYVKNKEGIGYHALYDYPYGALIEVDSIGMGCTLTHRSVYEQIMDKFTVFMRPNDSFMPVLKSSVQRTNVPFLGKQAENVTDIVTNGWHCQRVRVPHPDDIRGFPFFAMEYGRTEDHHFWELAAQVGIKPWVDTTIVCGHLKPHEVSYQDYKDFINEQKGLR